MPTPTFDSNFRTGLGEITQKLVVSKGTLIPAEQKIFDTFISCMKKLETATDPQIQQENWSLITAALKNNRADIPTDRKLFHGELVETTANLQHDDNICHWHFLNLMRAASDAILLLAERQKLSSVSDDLKAFRDAQTEYKEAKDEATEAIAKDYFSLDELDNKYANAVADERRYTEEVKQLEAQREYHEKSFQAIMVAYEVREKEKKAAAEAHMKAIDERDEQEKVARRAKEDYEHFVTACRTKEKKLRERAAEIDAKRAALNAELEKLAKDVNGETRLTVNAVSELLQKHTEAKKDLDARMAALTKKPKSETAVRANKLYGLQNGQLEHHRLSAQISAFTNALQANPRLAAEVEKQGDSYTRTDERNLKIIRTINTDSTRMGLQYLDMYNAIKRHYEQIDQGFTRYQFGDDGNVLRDAKGNPLRKKPYAQEFVETCHSLKDLLHHANTVDSIYNTLISRTLNEPAPGTQEAMDLQALHDAHCIYGAMDLQMHTAQNHLDSKQDELNRFCVAIYDESQQIEEQMKELQSDSQAKLRVSLLEKANQEEARLHEMEKNVETKSAESAEAFKAWQQVVRERDLWFHAENAKKYLQEAKEEKAKHGAALQKIQKAYEKHEAMVHAAQSAKANMTDGKLNLIRFEGTAKRIHSGLSTFVQTADIGREDLAKFTDHNYDRRSYNSTEYNAMIDALIAGANKDDLMKMRPEQMLESLATVRAAAQHYLDAKKAQWFHWVPSAQRKIRLNFAEEIIRFCDEAVVGVTAVKERANALEQGYAAAKLDSFKRVDKEQIRKFIGAGVKELVPQYHPHSRAFLEEQRQAQHDAHGNNPAVL